MKTSPRSQKLAGVIQTILPTLIPQFLTPNQIGLVTISAIEVSGDLGVADIFITHIGSQKEALKNLAKVTPKLEHELSRQLGLRRKIVLRFKEDKSREHVENIQNFTQ